MGCRCTSSRAVSAWHRTPAAPALVATHRRRGVPGPSADIPAPCRDTSLATSTHGTTTSLRSAHRAPATSGRGSCGVRADVDVSCRTYTEHRTVAQVDRAPVGSSALRRPTFQAPCGSVGYPSGMSGDDFGTSARLAHRGARTPGASTCPSLDPALVTRHIPSIGMDSRVCVVYVLSRILRGLPDASSDVDSGIMFGVSRMPPGSPVLKASVCRSLSLRFVLVSSALCDASRIPSSRAPLSGECL